MRLLEDYIENIESDDMTSTAPSATDNDTEPFERTTVDDWFMCIAFDTVKLQSTPKTKLRKFLSVTGAKISGYLEKNPHIESHSGVKWGNSYIMDICPDSDRTEILPKPPFGLSGTYACFTFTEKFTSPILCLKFISTLYRLCMSESEANDGKYCDACLVKTNRQKFSVLESSAEVITIHSLSVIYYLIAMNEYDNRSGYLSKFPNVLQGCVPFLPEVSTYQYCADLTGDDNLKDILNESIFRILNGRSNRKMKNLSVSKKFENNIENCFINGSSIQKFSQDPNSSVILYAYRSTNPLSQKYRYIDSIYKDDVAVLKSIKRDIMMKPVRCLDWKLKTGSMGRRLHIVFYLGVYKFEDYLYDAFISISTDALYAPTSAIKSHIKKGTEYNVRNFVRNLDMLLGGEIDRELAVETIVKGVEKNGVV